MNEIEYKNTVAGLIKEYGNATKVPTELIQQAQERLRAHHILLANPEISPVQVLRQYGVMEFIVKEHGDDSPAGRKPKRADKWATIIDWCETHTYEQVTPQQLAEIGGVAYGTVIKFINDRVDLFRKVKRGLYEIRDVKAERAAGV